MDFQTARTRMVDNQIRTTDVTDLRILRAFLTVPRETFVPPARQALAYIDQDVPLGGARYVMEASPLAKLIQLADIRDSDTVLLVGCGSGYTAAVLSHLAGKLVALEEDPALAAAARAALADVGAANCEVVEGALGAGYAAGAPYDLIFFDGAIGALPPEFADQLREGGRIVAVEGAGNAAEARLYQRERGALSHRFGFNCSIKPLPGFAKANAFVF